jgi:hypothetical protein
MSTSNFFAFCAVWVVSKESRRTSCWIYKLRNSLITLHFLNYLETCTICGVICVWLFCITFARATFLWCMYYDGFAQSIARQRLGKYIPRRNNRSSVLYVFRCWASASVPVDWLGSDHVGTPTDALATVAIACFLCVWSVQSGHKRGEFWN